MFKFLKESLVDPLMFIGAYTKEGCSGIALYQCAHHAVMLSAAVAISEFWNPCGVNMMKDSYWLHYLKAAGNMTIGMSAGNIVFELASKTFECTFSVRCSRGAHALKEEQRRLEDMVSNYSSL